MVTDYMDILTKTGKFYLQKLPFLESKPRLLTLPLQQVKGFGTSAQVPKVWSQAFPASCAPSSRGQWTGDLFAFTPPELAAGHCNTNNVDFN